MEAKFDDYLIRYEIKYDDDDGPRIWFIRIVPRASDPKKRPS